MGNPKTYLALDLGERRIGVAVGNSSARLARPLATVEIDGSELNKLARIAESEGVQALVIGLPRSLDGKDTAQTKRVRSQARALDKLGLPIYFQDEAATTVEAKNRGGSRFGVDAEAARIFLQDFLDGL